MTPELTALALAALRPVVRELEGRAGVLRSVEPFRQQDGEVVQEQVAQLVAVAERLVRRGVLALQAAEDLGEPWILVGRGALDVDEPGHPYGEVELVFEPRDVHVGRDPAVALPVDAHKDLALGQVIPVYAPRRVRPGAHLSR